MICLGGIGDALFGLGIYWVAIIIPLVYAIINYKKVDWSLVLIGLGIFITTGLGALFLSAYMMERIC